MLVARGVVALARGDFGVGARGLDADAAELAVARGFGGIVAEPVLAAQLL